MKKLLVLSVALLSISSFSQNTEISVNYNNTLPSVVNPYADRPSFSISTDSQMQMREVTVSPFPGVYITRQEPFFGNQTTSKNKQMTDDQIAEIKAQEDQMKMLQNNTQSTTLPNMLPIQPLTPNAPIEMLTNNKPQPQPKPQRQGQVTSEIKHTYTKDLSFFNQSTIREMEQKGKESLEREYRNLFTDM